MACILEEHGRPTSVFFGSGHSSSVFCSQVVSRSVFGASLELILAVLGIFAFCGRALAHVLRPHNVFLVCEHALCPQSGL